MLELISGWAKKKAIENVLKPIDSMVDENINDISTTIGSFIIRSVRGKFQRSITFTVGMNTSGDWMEEALYGIIYEYNDIKTKSKLELDNDRRSEIGSGLYYRLDDGTHNLKYRKWNILLFIQSKWQQATVGRSKYLRQYTIISYDLSPEFVTAFERDMIRNRNSILKIKSSSNVVEVYRDGHESDGYTYFMRANSIPKRRLSSIYLPYETKKVIVDTINEWVSSKSFYHEHGIPWNLKILLHGAPGPQPYSLEIPTPAGKKKFGDLQIGDEVFAFNGQPTKIVDIYERGEQDVYKITFSDGRTSLCGPTHNWPTLTSRGNIEKKTVEQMLEEGLVKDGNHLKFKIPLSGSAKFKYQKLPIDPWSLGVFIGNGCLTQKVLTVSSADALIPRYVANRIGANFKKINGDTYSWRFYDKKDGHAIKTEEFFKEFPEMCDYSYNKHIPDIYLYNSIENRYAILQGLMDTDGSICESDATIGDGTKRYSLSYSTTSEKLKDDIVFLIQSLGFSVSVGIDERDEYTTGKCYEIHIHVSDLDKYLFFRYSHKVERGFKARFRRYTRKFHRNPIIGIKNIEKLDYKENMRCIEVEDRMHLYQTNNFITTCNCGKDSLIRVIATEWNRNIIMCSGGKNGQFIPNCITDWNPFPLAPLYVISDIDKYPSLINEPDVDIKSAEGGEEKALIQKQIFGNMINALDGISSGEGKIIIMTTNHIEKFSDTFLRSGRIDLCLEIPSVQPQVFRKYMYDFYKIELPENIELVSDKISVSDLQKDAVFMKMSAEDMLKKYVK